jgi:Tfp pilus assembly protein PilV
MGETPGRCSIRSRASEEEGVTLIEVLIAITLLVVAMMSLAQVATSGLLSLRSSTDRTTAISLATQSLEASRQVPWTELALDESIFGGTCGSTVAVDDAGSLIEPVICAADGALTSDPPFWGVDGKFDLETYSTAISGFPNARRVTSVVSWDEGSTPREYRASTVIAQVDRG